MYTNERLEQKEELLNRIYRTSAYTFLEKEIKQKQGKDLGLTFKTSVKKVFYSCLKDYSDSPIEIKDELTILKRVIEKLPTLHQSMGSEKQLNFFLENLF